jgi:hypothetical protein
MLDPIHHDLASLLDDLIQHPVGTSPRREDPLQLTSQRLAYAVRLLDQCRGQELDDGSGYCLGESVTERPCS